jgi:DNA-binding NarL/FixJ family response regulator
MKILLVDDHALFREGLKLLLAKLNRQAEVLDAHDLAAALEVAEQDTGIELVLFDLGLPGVTGLAALAEFRRLNPALPVVVLSGLTDRRTVIEALEHGAMGFIPKSATPETLDHALQTVLNGGIHLPASTMEDAEPLRFVPGCPPLKQMSELNLTERQIQVFKLIVQGRPNKLIARDLGVSESTVKAHIKPILKALNVTSRVGAILEVARLGISLG